MTNRVTLSSLVFLGTLALTQAAQASTIFTLNSDGCTGTCGTGPFGTVSLVQTTATLVTVTETLAANERFAGTGAGDALEFNVAGPVTISGLTTGFGVGPSPDTASTFGSFLHSVTCTACKGGKSENPAGPLSFTITSATGVTLADFKANNGGYFFASDIVGNNGNTGNVASKGSTPSPAPEPATMAMLGAGLVSVGFIRKRAKR